MQPGTLLAGKRGLVMGVANDKSIAWGIAETAAKQGAEIAFSYQMEGFGKRLAHSGHQLWCSKVHNSSCEGEPYIPYCLGETGFAHKSVRDAC